MGRFPPVGRDDWVRAPAGLEPVAGGSVTAAPGFRAAGVACGLKASGALDLGILAADRPVASALVDTRNALPSAPVLRNRDLDRARIRAVVVNAGSANAATGSPGLDDADAMARRAAARLGMLPEEVAVSSTGTIGDRIDLERVGPGIDAAAAALSPDGGPDFGQAICTTDRAPKGGAFRLALARGEVLIGAAAKGAGMISPAMATMLAYITVGAPVAPDDLQAMAVAASAGSFNRISVDGQMSPSDTLIVMAGGEGPALAGADRDRLAAALGAVCRWLAIQIVRDGEGATHAVRVVVDGARDVDEAEWVARAVGDSPLVKTAIFGRDPNWGRVTQAVGAALVGAPGPVAEPAITVDGVPAASPQAPAVLAREEYDLGIGLGRGEARAELWACDLGHEYVRINAEYRT
ncbi:MAG TPA: bifunctional glutamate N-acetyltransferase/amino-acid acetyltransferase ArgJ [Miltoncostaeaceae bacterium]|jgi:glutamate N-acetyltransferase/amino-acid N-acetyltransferase|nr:bifunctional glutamate N-acetyltransferase/amino-acid acetyltransferase ArgJ [Miltoncostaeaceae bacterium]